MTQQTDGRARAIPLYRLGVGGKETERSHHGMRKQMTWEEMSGSSLSSQS